MNERGELLTPVIGLSGQPIPFTWLVDVRPGPAGTDDGACFRLRPSAWLDGLTEAGLPSPLAILGDVAVGGAALAGRPHQRVVTESLRVDLLGRAPAGLHAVAGATAAGPRRVMVVCVIRDRPGGEVVGQVVGRVALLGPRSVGAAPDPPADTAPGCPATARQLLEDGAYIQQTGPDMVRLRVPVTADFGNSYGFMHGGAAAVFSDVGLHRLRCHPAAGLSGARLQSMSLDYLVPVPLAGMVTVTARVAERAQGRALVVVGIAGTAGPPSTIASYTMRLASC